MGDWLYHKTMPRPDGSVFKITTPRKYRPVHTALPPAKVLNTFMSQLDELDHVLELCQYIDLQKMKLPFLFVGGLKLRLGDGLRFIVAHCERHLLQARLVLEQLPPEQQLSLS